MIGSDVVIEGGLFFQDMILKLNCNVYQWIEVSTVHVSKNL